MKINKLSHLFRATSQYREAYRSHSEKKANSLPEERHAQESDAVKVATHIAKATEGKRTKLEHLKEKINNNDYNPPVEQVAKKLARELFI